MTTKKACLFHNSNVTLRRRYGIHQEDAELSNKQKKINTLSKDKNQQYITVETKLTETKQNTRRKQALKMNRWGIHLRIERKSKR